MRILKVSNTLKSEYHLSMTLVSIEEFIYHYNEVVSEAESKGVNDFEVIKASRLEGCSLSHVEKQLALSGIDFKKTKHYIN